jgi:hypothetical protein
MKPKDFLKYICMKCPKSIDEGDTFPFGCTTYATRDHAPTLCPCRGEPNWEIERVLWSEGNEP